MYERYLTVPYLTCKILSVSVSFLSLPFPSSLSSRYSAPSGRVRTEREAILRSSVERAEKKKNLGDCEGGGDEGGKRRVDDDVDDAPVILEDAVRRRQSGELFKIPRVLLWNVYDDRSSASSRDDHDDDHEQVGCAGGDVRVRVGQTALFDRARTVPVQ